MRRGGAYDRFRMMLEAFLERGCEVHCLSLTPIQIYDVRYRNHVLRIPARMQETFAAKLVVLFLFPLYAVWIGYLEEIDLFVAFGPLYAFLQSVSKWILRKPMVTLIRLDLLQDSKTSKLVTTDCLGPVIEYVGLISSDHILSTNVNTQQEVKKLLRNRRTTRVDVLFNDIQTTQTNFSWRNDFPVRERFRIPKEARIIVTAGLITPRKNLDVVLVSLSQVATEDLFLIIAGDPGSKADFRYRKHLEKMTQELGLMNRVIFTGWIKKEELWKIFRVSDLFILPSKSEGMPNVMLEALGCDLPCLGSNIPGIKDILKYEELMFDPLDEKKLANKLGRVFSDHQLFSQMNRLCQERKTAFIFDWKEKVFEMVTGGF